MEGSEDSKQAKKKHIDEYEFLKQVGEGAFGNVYLALEKANQSLVAVKVLDKTHIVKFDKTKAVYREKDILNKFVLHPNVIRLDSVFQVRYLNSYCIG